MCRSTRPTTVVVVQRDCDLDPVELFALSVPLPLVVTAGGGDDDDDGVSVGGAGDMDGFEAGCDGRTRCEDVGSGSSCVVGSGGCMAVESVLVDKGPSSPSWRRGTR